MSILLTIPRRFFAGRAFIFAAVLVLALNLAGCRGAKESKAPVEKASAQNAKPDVKPVKEEKAQPPVLKPDAPKLEVLSKGVSLTWEEGGKLKMQAVAREIVGNQLAGKGTMKDARVSWYDNGKLATVMQAPLVEAEQSNKVLTASGGVVVRSIPRNTIVKAKWLKWFAAEHRVVGNGGVTVTSDMGTIKSAGLVADTELKTIQFTSQGSGGSASFKP